MTIDEAKELMIGYMNNGYNKDSKRYTDIYLFTDKLNQSLAGKEVLQRVQEEDGHVRSGRRDHRSKRSYHNEQAAAAQQRRCVLGQERDYRV